MDKSSYVVVQINDMQGRVMFSKDVGLQPIGEHSEEINIGSFADGTYVYTVQTGAVKLAGRLVVN
ncbi:MAG: T9SS type A sorting domain-containing protein [Bacteroidota bacterium]